MPFHRQHPRVTAPHSDQLVTKQSHKDECDITNILNQYKKTGIITHVQQARPTYTDLPSDLDYQAALNTMIEAEQAFEALPAKVRDHFDNDPQAFLAAFHDKDGKHDDKLREFGLIHPKDHSPGPPKPASSSPASQGSEAPSPAAPPRPEPTT